MKINLGFGCLHVCADDRASVDEILPESGLIRNVFQLVEDSHLLLALLLDQLGAGAEGSADAVQPGAGHGPGKREEAASQTSL